MRVTEAIRILLIDEDPKFLHFIQKTLKRQERFEIVGCCQNKKEAVAMAYGFQPNIVLIDPELGGSLEDGLQISREIRILTDAKVLILTAVDTPQVLLKISKESFASGCVFKGQTRLLKETILELAKGRTAQEYLMTFSALSCLSDAEMAVFQKIIGGGGGLHSSPKTIANQTTGILKKLGLESKKELRHVFRILTEEK